MDKKVGALIVGVITVVFIIGAAALIWIAYRSNNPPTAASSAPTATDTLEAVTSTNNIAVAPVAPDPSPAATPSPAIQPASHPAKPPIAAPSLPRAVVINLITPISGNAWTIGGSSNLIAWSTAANITAEIDLLDAQTKALVGVILSETGPNQTSYSWDARSVALARYSPDKKDVVPGTYAVRITFDGNGLGELVSGPITISK